MQLKVGWLGNGLLLLVQTFKNISIKLYFKNSFSHHVVALKESQLHQLGVLNMMEVSSQDPVCMTLTQGDFGLWLQSFAFC